MQCSDDLATDVALHQLEVDARESEREQERERESARAHALSLLLSRASRALASKIEQEGGGARESARFGEQLVWRGFESDAQVNELDV